MGSIPGVKRQTVSEFEEEVQEIKAKKEGRVFEKKKRPEKEKPAKKKKVIPPDKPPPGEEPPVDIGRLDLRVGKTIWVQPHPLSADQHYMQHTNIGNPRLNIVISKLVQHYQEADLTGRGNVVLMNLKPPYIHGMRPDGVTMCAVKDDKIELLNAPETAEANDNIFVPGYPKNPDYPHMKNWKRIYETVCEDLRVTEDKIVVYKNIPLQVEGRQGFITTNTLSDCPVKWV